MSGLNSRHLLAYKWAHLDANTLHSTHLGASFTRKTTTTSSDAQTAPNTGPWCCLLLVASVACRVRVWIGAMFGPVYSVKENPSGLAGLLEFALNRSPRRRKSFPRLLINVVLTSNKRLVKRREQTNRQELEIQEGRRGMSFCLEPRRVGTCASLTTRPITATS